MIKMIKIEERYCDSCGEDLETRNGHPYISEDKEDYCFTCACKKGLSLIFKYCGKEVYDRVLSEDEG